MKKIIYLDQVFYSSAFRGDLKYRNALDTLLILQKKNIISCPYSGTHLLETSFWEGGKKNQLSEYIKHYARSYVFKSDHVVKTAQVKRAYNAFIRCKNKKINLLKSDVLDERNKFLDIFDIENLNNSRNIQQCKDAYTEEFIKKMPEWRKNKATFEEDIKQETDFMKKVMIESFQSMLQAYCYKDDRSLLNTPRVSLFVHSLLGIDLNDNVFLDKNEKKIHKKIQTIMSFFNSNYFTEIPYVKLTAQLCALLKKEVRNGWLQNIEKAKHELSGFYFDTVHIAVFAPYCKCLYTDNKMRELLEKNQDSIFKQRRIKIFSKKNFNEFLNYLENLNKTKQ